MKNTDTLDIDDRDPEEGDARVSPETAFQRAQEHFYKGRRLNNFSFLRQTAVGAMGLRFGSLNEEEITRLPNPDFAKLQKVRKKLRGKLPARERRTLEADLEKLKDEGPELVTYKGIATDAARVVWVCLQTDSVCQRVRRKPDEYEIEVDRWAQKEGLKMGSKALNEVISVFSMIMAEIQESEGVPKLDSDGEPESPN